MGFGEADHRGDVLLSLHHVRGTQYLPDFPLWMLTVAEVVSVRFLHFKLLLPSSIVDSLEGSH